MLSGCSSSDPQDSKAQNDNVATWGDSSTGSDELDILTGGYPDSIIDCGSTMSVNSVLVYNQTDAPQTYSVTVNKQLANELVFYPEVSSAQGVSSGCQDIYSGSASTQTVTVQPGDAVQSAIIAGGGQWNDLDNNHNVAIGAGGQAWYDFWLHEGAKNNFKNLELNYSNTGGTNPSQNVQSGLFNVMQCTTDGSQVAVSNSIISTYTSNNANAWTFNQNEPLCFAFLNPTSS
ncbi:MAG: hypothetical protein KDC39_12585 [Actinobacteria bacterium]|nr:hypothetical protein [Actinomycetota bacterium]